MTLVRNIILPFFAKMKPKRAIALEMITKLNNERIWQTRL